MHLEGRSWSLFCYHLVPPSYLWKACRVSEGVIVGFHIHNWKSCLELIEFKAMFTSLVVLSSFEVLAYPLLIGF